jgi:hypothetical protein
LKLVKVNADESPELRQRFEVLATPTLLLVVRGEFIDKQLGAAPAGVADLVTSKLDLYRLMITSRWFLTLRGSSNQREVPVNNAKWMILLVLIRSGWLQEIQARAHSAAGGHNTIVSVRILPSCPAG